MECGTLMQPVSLSRSFRGAFLVGSLKIAMKLYINPDPVSQVEMVKTAFFISEVQH
jgi:hypothetical protein